MAATDIAEEAFNLRLGYLKPETVEIARVELRETEEVKAAAIIQLRELLKATPELNYKDDDAFLTVFLRACHFYPEGALEKVRTIIQIYEYCLQKIQPNFPKLNQLMKGYRSSYQDF